MTQTQTQPLALGNAILATCKDAAHQLTARQANPHPRRVDLQNAYLEVLNSGLASGAVSQSDRLFTTVMDLTPEDKPALRTFFNGWRDTHVSSDLVTILAGRLHGEGAHAAGGEMLGVVFDDVGYDSKAGRVTKPHRDMYKMMANTVLSEKGQTHEDWEDKKYATPSCASFREYITDARVYDDPEIGILTTAASEKINAGEYTALTKPMHGWMVGKMEMPLGQANGANAYIRVHGGETELGHFLHAIDAWDLYAAHAKRPQRIELAAECLERYLVEVGNAYKGLVDKIEAVRDDGRLLRRHDAALSPALI